MECRIPVMLRWLTTATLAFLFFLPWSAGAEETVVLATSSTCPVTEVSSLDVRKAYLGVSLRLDGYNIRPLRLGNDARLNQVFFQSVVAMSRKSYERRLLSLALKSGTPRPTEYDSVGDAISAVRRIQCSVVYAWKKDLESVEGIKIIRVLWQR